MRARDVCRAIVVVSAVSPEAVAGNLDSYYMASDAALQAGAITADSGGGGAIWYNPAGLSAIAGLRFDVSVSAFRLSLGGVPDVEAAFPGAEVTHLRSLDIDAVPTSLTLTRGFGELGVGFGLFVPVDDSNYLRTEVEGRASGDLGAFELGIDERSTLRDFYAGPGFGLRLGSLVRLGASLFAHYRTSLSTSGADLYVTSTEGDEAAYIEHETDDRQQIGAELVVGLRLEPADDWSAGITLRTPSLRIYEIRQQVSMSQLAVQMSALERPSSRFEQHSGFDADVISPGRLHLGLSHDFGELRAALEANYQLGLDDDESQRKLLPVANWRVGVRWQVTPTLRLGGGAYTDHSPIDASRFTDRALDYYGVTIGGELSTPYQVTSKRGRRFEHPKVLAFSTGVALSYAVGIGQVVRAEVATAENTIDLREVPTTALAHELILHLTSSLFE